MDQQPRKKSIHIIGIGNLTRFDDGIAIKIIEELSKKDFPPEIKITDLGTGGIDLIFALDGWEKAIIIDAIDMPDLIPGTIIEYNITDESLPEIKGLSSTHGFNIISALKMAFQLQDYNLPKEIIIIGIQITNIEGVGTTISPEVSKIVPEVVNTIEKRIKKIDI